MRHHAKFHQNPSNGCRGMAIICFLKMAAVRHIGFVGCDIGTTGDEQLVVSIFVQKLVEINAVVSII